MDVRCDQCQTVYELDDARLKPGGVTVKCTQCLHIFRVGETSTRGGATDPIALATNNPAAQNPVSAPRGRQSRNTSLGFGAPNNAASSKQWFVRFADGGTATCAELSTLQQWIVSGRADREAFISRNESTWKRLGDIPELAPYFKLADELHAGAAPLPGRVRPDARPSGRAASESQDTAQRKRPSTAVPQPLGPQATERVFGVPGVVAAQAGAASSPAAAAAGERAARPSRASVPPPVPAAAMAAASAAAAAGVPSTSRAHEIRPNPEPGFRGRARLALNTDAPAEAAFVRRDAARSEPPPDYPELPGYARGGDSRLGKWIALVAVLVIVVSGFVVARMLGFGGSSGSGPVATPMTSGDAAVGDGAPALDGAQDATNTATLLAEALASYDAILGRDVLGELEAAALELGAASDAAAQGALTNAQRQGLQARMLVAVAQQHFDLEALADEADKRGRRDKAQAALLAAVAAAQRALKEGANPDASLAMAGIARLQKKPAREVETYLSAAGAPAYAVAVALERAMVGIRDGATAASRAALAKLEAQGASARGEVRPQVRLAMVAALATETEAATSTAAAVLAVVPTHVVARRIAEKLHANVDNATTSADGVVTSDGQGEESYDRVLARADRAAESDCRTAMPLYQKALAMRPASVEALAGAAFCHLSASEFASAHAKFRQALAVSRKFEPALRGVAEAYVQQGRTAEAIAAYKEYLEVYPGSAVAKRQLDRLGAAGSDRPTPTPTPTPAPDAPSPPPVTPVVPADAAATVEPSGPVASPD
ncbi:MAG: zinc-ribbon domain-containing protein [Myxococcales bacterium]|nr:zinc-ribbon domain-containing protein [Myxococcales bacterium]